LVGWWLGCVVALASQLSHCWTAGCILGWLVVSQAAGDYEGAGSLISFLALVIMCFVDGFLAWCHRLGRALERWTSRLLSLLFAGSVAVHGQCLRPMMLVLASNEYAPCSERSMGF